MTDLTITKQIEKLEVTIKKLHTQLVKTQCSKIEVQYNKQKSILYHLEKIQGLIRN